MMSYCIPTVAGILAGGGAALAFTLPWEWWTSVITQYALIVTVLTAPRKVKGLFLFIFALIYGWSFINTQQAAFMNAGWRTSGREIILEGEVRNLPEKSFSRLKFEMQLRRFRTPEGEWQDISGAAEILVRTEELAPLVGDILILKGTLRFPSAGEPGEAWSRNYLFWRGIAAQVYVKNLGNVVFAGWNHCYFPQRALQLVREWMDLKLTRLFSPEQAWVLKALLIGVQTPDPVLQKIFTRTGTVHLLSVSGFHTSVVAGFIFAVFILCGCPPLAAVRGASAVTLGYMVLSGWGAAVQRSGLMTVGVWLAWASGRPQKLIDWLNLSLGIMLWVNPRFMGSISFQLSFLAMYGLLLVTPHLFLIKNVIVEASMAAFLATYPLVLWHFQSFAWSGIFANLIAVPMFALILPLGFIALIPGPSFLALPAVKILLGITLWFLKIAAAWEYAAVYLPRPELGLVLGYYLTGSCLLWLYRHRAALPLPAVL